MTPAPASILAHPSFGFAGRVIGLFLARLLACLVRFETSGQRRVPSDIAHMVASADELVHTFIRRLTAAHLEIAGYSFAARALRTRAGPQSDTTTQTDHTPATPADLIERLNASIAIFERAEALANLLACVMICALSGALSERGRHPVRARFADLLMPRSASLIRPALPPWPPPADMSPGSSFVI